jgi:RimJ/RimL family protein N-acetyltransferase
MKLSPIYQDKQQNAIYEACTTCQEILPMHVSYYDAIGYKPPWIGYFVQHEGQWVGSAGFKGAPQNGQVEIAYVTFEAFRNRGLGTKVCQALVELAKATDPELSIRARTLREPNFSTRILEKNNFKLLGTVEDPEDGPVWEWEYAG